MKRKILCLVTCIAVSFVGLAGANPSILWEDFEDENGNGAFDPAFIHTFDDQGYYDFYTYYNTGPVFSLNDWITDYVTFNLEEGQFVSHASLDVLAVEGDGSIQFIGETDSVTYNIYQSNSYTLEADMSEIGSIHAIQMSAYYSIFDGIKITVVPEPATWMLFILGVAVTGVFSTKGRKGRKDIFRVFGVFRG